MVEYGSPVVSTDSVNPNWYIGSNRSTQVAEYRVVLEEEKQNLKAGKTD